MNYKAINDYEILYLVSEDMDTSYDLLFQKYLPIIKSISKKYLIFVKKHGAEYQDLIQEGFLGLNNAILSYRDNANSIFYTYACLCIERHIFTFCRSLSAQKHQVLNMCVSEESYLPTIIKDDSEESNFFQDFSFDLQNIIIQGLYSLDLQTRCVFELRFNGFSYREISELLCLSISTIDSKLCKARKFLKKLLETYN